MLCLGFSLGVAAVALLLSSINFSVVNRNFPQITTNQQFIESTRTSRLNLNDVDAVFAQVFSQLPDQVIVYPTENYYYFKFFDGPHEVWGNIRLDSEDRKMGKISFAYYLALNRPEAPFYLKQNLHYKIFDPDGGGPTLQQIAPLSYEMAYRGKKVIFQLNDLPQTVPRGLKLQPSESFLYRTFDESGFQFALLFDDTSASFRFILDPTAPIPDTLVSIADHLYIGRRSGFAFYQDDELHRLILIGVDQKNLRENNYFDGPFDQLADNFVHDDTLLQAFERAFPMVTGKITSRGVLFDTEKNEKYNRIALQPHLKYISYAHLLQFVTACEQEAGTDTSQRNACLTHDSKQVSVPQDK